MPQSLSMSILSLFYNDFISGLLSFNSPPPTSHSISINPNNTTTAAPPSSAPHLISHTQSDRPILSLNPFDLELGNQTFPSFSANHNNELLDWKQDEEVVQIIGLGGAGVSIILIVNPPSLADTYCALYITYLIFVCLGLFMGMGFSFFSLVMKGSPVGRAQKSLIFFTLFFVLMACFLRFPLALPLDDIGFGMAAVITGIAVMVLYLWLGWRCQRRMHEK